MNVRPKRARPLWPEGSRSSKAKMTPLILLAATSPWFATARLATAFVSAGCAVEVVCPLGHPPRDRGRCRPCIRISSSLRSIPSVAPFRAVHPDLIIPCDDLARVGGAVDDVGSDGA